MIPTANPFLDPRIRETRFGLEREMSQEEALGVLDGPKPEEWWEVSNWSSAYYLKGETETALRYAEQAIDMQESVATCINMAVILEANGRFREALPYAYRAYRCDPNDKRASALVGEALLRLGRFDEGWPYYVHNRVDFSWLLPVMPEWKGPEQGLKGQKLLVIEYGGFGDNFYFSRALPKLKEWGAKITYLCQAPLAPLFASMGYDVIPNYAGNADINFYDYDCFTWLCSLGMKLAWNERNIPWNGPYIHAPRKWRWDSRLHIGFCSKAGEGASPRKTRFLTEEQRNRILDAFPYGARMSDFTLVTGSWLDTAKAINKLDLMVTVDTGVAHLAAAMGKPTWVILPGCSAWQYLVDSERHPFYPTMRMFRNNTEGMDNAVKTCIKALEEEL